MKKITDYIIKWRYIFLSLFIIAAIFSFILSSKVNINQDIMKYLPLSSETKIGKDIMNEEFTEQNSSELNVMFKDLDDDEINKTLDKLENIDGVSSVEYANTDAYNKDNYTLFILKVSDYSNSDVAKKVYNYVIDNFDVVGVDGSIYEENKPVLELWIVIIAIISGMIILIILSDSYVEPWLYLISIGVAVFINKGTNIMFDSVSSITNSIVAILQLALSMDYSIMLSNRYKQEKMKTSNKVKAMEEALFHSFMSIFSSSITTIVGLLALVFMSFSIGRDLGFVLAKGVLLSLISIFFCLPALLLIFDDLVAKTQKKSPIFNLDKLGEFTYKTRYFQTGLIIILFVGAFLLKDNISILYTDSEKDKVAEVFPVTNQVAIVYNNEYEELISDYCKKLEENEKIDQVLCYSNTINEKLAYDELNNKFREFGQSFKIDEYLVKLIYYNYYNKDNNKITLNEFISFIKSDIYTNGTFNKLLDQNIKDSLNLLENFASESMIYKLRTTDEIADILGISREDAKNILIYYNSLNLDTRMTISEFVNFMLNDVANDTNYSSRLDRETISKLKQLQNFSELSNINKKMNSNELANLFGIDSSLIEQLLLFYRTTIESNTKMTLNQFANFSLEMANDESFSNMFDQKTINSLIILATLSNEEIISNDLELDTMKSYLNNFGINLDDNLTLLYIYYTGYNSNSRLTMDEFVTTALDMSNNDTYRDYFSDDIISSLTMVQSLCLNYNVVLSNNKLYEMFGIDSITGLGLNYIITGSLFKSYSMTPLEFVNTLLSNESISSMLNDGQKASLELAQYIMTNISYEYSVSELANLLSQDESIISFVYGVYNYQSGNLNSISIKTLINFLYDNKSNPMLSSKLEEYSNILDFGYLIANNTATLYNYSEISNITGVDVVQINQVFAVYDYLNYENNITPLEFSNLILDNLDNELLSKNISHANISELSLVRNVMISTLNNTYYSSTGLSSLLGMDSSTFSLLFSLYNSKYIEVNQEISLINYVNFIIDNVMNNNEYSSKFGSNEKEKLNIVNLLMNNSINNVDYTDKDLFTVLSILNDNLDKSLIELVYIYYGSVNEFDDNWKMTIEEFINYLTHDIINDPRLKPFINTGKKLVIKGSKSSIDKSKSLVVSNNYSRVVLNTKYALEDSDTFDFINSIHKDIGDNDDIYVVGNSAMAVELSKTFNGELNRITILTMIFIFIVVAITFKDLIIPFILVLIVQTAVYITMSFISVAGGDVYFISILIVQAILMGATIDYAIVYTSYYRESRLSMGVRDSIVNAYNKSIHTIICSATILIIVTLVVAYFASAIAAKICETISQGTFVSAFLILFLLPGVLVTVDRLICRNGYYDDKSK